MMIKMNCVIVAFVLIIAASNAQTATNAQKKKVVHITIGEILGNTNWGKFKKAQLCPADTKINGFRLKMQKNDTKDKTGINGIQLSCTGGTETQSEESHMGKWEKFHYCDTSKTSYVVSFNYRSLKEQPRGVDDYAGTDIQMVCNNGKVINGSNLDKGDWQFNVLEPKFYPKCKSGTDFYGMQIQVEGPAGDTTGVNHVKFLCSSYSEEAASVNGWEILGSNVCMGTMNSQFGILPMPTSGFLKSVRIVRRSGKTTCYDRSKGAYNNFGCNYPGYQSFFSVFVTSSLDDILFPKKGSVHYPHRNWYSLPGLTGRTAEAFELKHPTENPSYIGSGMELRLWYGEDLWSRVNRWTARAAKDNDKTARLCVDVYGQFKV